MRFLLDLFGGSPLLYASAGVVALVAAMLLIKTVGALWPFLRGARRKSRRRLSLVESTKIDGSRRVVLIRRDDVEFTILTGGPQDVILETGLSRAASGRTERAAPGLAPPAPADRVGASVAMAPAVPALTQVKPTPGRLPAGSPAASPRGLRGAFQRKA